MYQGDSGNASWDGQDDNLNAYHYKMISDIYPQPEPYMDAGSRPQLT
jgi:hypothetical protein